MNVPAKCSIRTDSASIPLIFKASLKWLKQNSPERGLLKAFRSTEIHQLPDTQHRKLNVHKRIILTLFRVIFYCYSASLFILLCMARCTGINHIHVLLQFDIDQTWLYATTHIICIQLKWIVESD